MQNVPDADPPLKGVVVAFSLLHQVTTMARLELFFQLF